MTQSIDKPAGAKALECFQCGDAVTIGELLLVDDLIDQSPFLTGLSESFGLCSGDERRFHGNVVNCCAACYALIVQPMALWDDADRRVEIGNIARALRGCCGTGEAGVERKNGMPASAAINLEHLLASLLDMDPGSPVPGDAVHEALYMATSPYYALFG
jgi:hypothetical protein